MANADVSSGIVGYQTIKIAKGAYQLFTVTFEDVSLPQYDIQDIKVVTAEGADYTTNNKIKIQKISSNGDYATQYNYRQGKGGWCQSATFVGKGVVFLGSGEGVCVNNSDTVNDVYLRVSGAVTINPVSMTVAPSSFTIIGNMTPVEIDLQDVVPYAGDAIYATNNRIKVQKIKANGDYDTQYNYRKGKGGWCQSADYIGRDAVKLAPGESLCVNNSDTATSIVLKFPSPIVTE